MQLSVIDTQQDIEVSRVEYSHSRYSSHSGTVGRVNIEDSWWMESALASVFFVHFCLLHLKLVGH